MPVRLNTNNPDTDNDDDETDQGTIYYPDGDLDLLVLDEAGCWEHLPEEHKIASNTSPLSFATGMGGEAIDVIGLATSPCVSSQLSLVGPSDMSKPNEVFRSEATSPSLEQVPREGSKVRRRGTN